jgi:hypothetical protein
MAWHRLAGVKNINVSTPSRGVGAHIELAHTLGHLEITIVKQSDNNLACWSWTIDKRTISQ